MVKRSISALIATIVLGNLVAMPSVVQAQNYAPRYTPTPKTDFDRAIERAPQEARRDPPTPPSTVHDNRLPAGRDGSVGGSFGAGGGSLNYKRTTK